MNEIFDFECLRLALASPETIKTWSHGEITKPETINYRTLKPEKDGLFCERIFGPTKDWECYCGKYKRIRYKGIICDKCGVEVTQSRVRRERLGHINLAAPVAHNWFFKGSPSKISLLLDLSPRHLEAVIYFASYLVIDVDQAKRKEALVHLEEELVKSKEKVVRDAEKEIKEEEEHLRKDLTKVKQEIKNKEQKELKIEELELNSRRKIACVRDNMVVEESRAEEIFKAVQDMVNEIAPFKLLSEEEYYKMKDYGATSFFDVGIGAEAILKVLQQLDLDKISASLKEESQKKTTGQRYIKITKRLRVVEGLRLAKLRPEWMVLRVLPVLPPELRPMVQLSGGRFATSDLNDLYRRVINRNNRLKRLMELGAPEIILRNEKRMLQEAVDALIDTADHVHAKTNSRVKVLRSLSDMLRGKQGRFRQNLLGKRVDYSGRSVIVVGPKLSLHQTGLPKEMALEMFKPFVLRDLIAKGLAPNMRSAKHVI